MSFKARGAQPAAPGAAAPTSSASGTAAPGAKLRYEKPRLRAIDLAAEEVLAVGCKLDGGPGGPIGASCTASSCFAPGS